MSKSLAEIRVEQLRLICQELDRLGATDRLLRVHAVMRQSTWHRTRLVPADRLGYLPSDPVAARARFYSTVLVKEP